MELFPKDWDPTMTLEAPPNIDNYRLTIQKNIRPSMPELMHGSKRHLSASDMPNGVSYIIWGSSQNFHGFSGYRQRIRVGWILNLGMKRTN